MNRYAVTKNHKLAIARKIGERIKIARGDNSQKRLAELAEMHVNTLGKIERGSVIADSMQLLAIAAVTRTSAAWLLLGDALDKGATSTNPCTTQAIGQQRNIKSLSVHALEVAIGNSIGTELHGTANVTVLNIECGEPSECNKAVETIMQLKISTPT